MTAYEYLLVDLITFIYNIAWLVFLIHKHYGQVTTTAGHIFELNVLLNFNVNVILLIIIVDLEVSPWDTVIMQRWRYLYLFFENKFFQKKLKQQNS